MPQPKFFEPQKDMAARRIIRAPQIVMVEGPDDLWFFDALLSDMGASPDAIQLVDYGSTSLLEASLRLLMLDEMVLNGEVAGLLVTRDADASEKKALYDLEKACEDVNLGKLAHGIVSTNPGRIIKKVGIYLMPAVGRKGNLETLLLETVDSAQPVVDARQFVETHNPERAPTNDKRVAQAYLATKERLSRGAGYGAKQGYFDLSHSSLDVLRSMLGDLLK